MNISKILAEDLENLISDPHIPWEKLRKSSVLITGATGMLGKAVVETLGVLNEMSNYDISIYAIGRNLEKGSSLEQINGVKFIAIDIRKELDVPYAIDYIIHCAAVTESAKMVSDPISVIDTELKGGQHILELARSNNTKGMVYTSSMEVYGMLNLPEVRETDLGFIDLTSPRSSYPQSKRMVESMCNCYHAQYDLPVNIVRLGMTFGAGEDFMRDNRVWAQFARCALTGAPITLHTTGASISSFVYTTDAVRGIFLVLLSPVNGETYNIASTCLKIRELAERVAKEFNLEVILSPPADSSKMGYASEFKLPLNTDKVRTIGWKPQVEEIEEMFKRTIGDFHLKQAKKDTTR